MGDKTEKTPRNLAKETYKMWSRLSQHDQLTGLLNKRGLISVAEKVRSNIERENLNSKYAITVLDMIGLKALNIKYTEPKVDKMVADSADRMQKSVRKSDLVARLREGGDEFLILSFDTSPSGIYTMLDTIRSGQKDEINFNAVFKEFEIDTDLDEAIDFVVGEVDEIKKTLPRDSTGRVVGNGVTVEIH